jgi:hypothetical protein
MWEKIRVMGIPRQPSTDYYKSKTTGESGIFQTFG